MMSLNAIFEIGFLMGLIGSVHCIGMCGPLVMALPIAQQTNFQKWQSILLYHFGKITSYAIKNYFKIKEMKEWNRIAKNDFKR